jgi:hypothetical protein
LQVLYAIDGNPQVPESVLGHLDGYKGSRPVRVGNSAVGQLQLDIYGELMDSVYLFNKYGRPIGYDLWEALGRQLDWPEKSWQLLDDGIWESRGGRRRSTYSAPMTGVAFERAIRIGRQRAACPPPSPTGGTYPIPPMKPFSGRAGARTAGPTSNTPVERPAYGVHALRPVGHLQTPRPGIGS